MNHFRALISSVDLLSKDHKNDKHLEEEIKIYDANNLEHCPWPSTVDGLFAQKLLTPFIQKGVSKYIDNVQTEMKVLVFDELVFPITINDAEYDNSYVCSPYSYFISYAKESLDFLPYPWLCHTMAALLEGTGKILRHFNFNKVVVVNNWLYSTNLYPQLQQQDVLRIVQFLQHSFPHHAIVFRSIDPYTNPICYETLQKVGFEYIATRQIYFINPHESTLFESRLFKSDMKLLTNSGYEIVGGEHLTQADLPRLLELYRDLYINKYSDLNPKFTEDFLRLVLANKILNFKVMKKNGRIDGVVGYVQRNGKMYCPFFGYDRTVPKEVALYRMLSTVLMLEAHDRRLLFHQSSGASMFKKIRKAHGCIEYTAVHYKHLPFRRQMPWLVIKNLYNSLGIIYMKRY